MSSNLTGLIQSYLAGHGPATFRWFMEQALYHPEHGYYASGKARIGRGGDFFTNVSVGPLFGRMLSTQFREIWERMERPSPFFIVEQGAHDGQFACDVLEALRQLAPDFLEAAHYKIVEPFDAMRKTQEEKLHRFGEKIISWSDSISKLAPFCGIHFSNELLDAMPVHLLVLREDGWKERCVDWRQNAFTFVERAIRDEGLKRYVTEREGPFRDGMRLEANLDALAWVDSLAAKLQRGYVLAIDYGDANPAARARETGTLACYRSHRRIDDPLGAPGEIDITARVDFSAVARHAVRAGFQIEGFTDQHRFMTGLAANGLPDIGTEHEKKRRSLAFNQLAHPDLMGTHFKVLCLGKNVETGGPLRGFTFGRDPAAALGLPAR